MELAGKKILVTGADGFIGSHLVDHLVRSGHDVRAFVLYNSFGSRGWLDHTDAAVQQAIDVFAGDVRDPFGVRQAMSGCDVVLHLAALIAIPYSYHSPASYVQTNVSGTLNVVQAARDLDVERVVATSTSEVYGSAQTVPIDETHPLVGQSPYAATKIGADQLALSFHKAFETPVTILRPFNTYGPRQSTRAIVPTVITQIASGKRTLKLGALTPTRDLNHVADTVAAFEAVTRCDEAVGRVLNAGSGFEISIGDLVALIAEVMGAEVTVETDQQRLRPQASEVERLLADASALRALTGWAPQLGGDREGLARGLQVTAEWFSDPTNLARYDADRYQL